MTSCKVVSKYFSSLTVMDESLSDFQEKKPTCIPKNTQKPKPKRKRNVKLLKGQKDIRKLVKNKNELLAYSKDFRQICKQSGLDVDPEQLQLAIALSKSLQGKEIESGVSSFPCNDSLNSQKALTSQERSNKIKKTLQEYGFKVPEVKINVNKRKKRTNNYKLLLSTESEKLQIVSDKYAEVLLTNNCNFSVENNQDNTENNVYNKATSISYDDMKNENVFYTNLVKKNTSKSFLLRDWSEIPGRPKSPGPLQVVTVNFDNIECTQDELDSILSGSIKLAQDIVKNKMLKSSCDNLRQHNLDEVVQRNNNYKAPKRSLSPDMFADEISEVAETTHFGLSALETIGKTNNKSDYMDLTECIAPTALRSQTDTIRKSNDFMEITECAHQKYSQNVDLTHNDKSRDDGNEIVLSLDLTQSSDSNDLPVVQVGGTQDMTLQHTIILDANEGDLKETNDLNENTIEISVSNDFNLDNKNDNLADDKLENIEDDSNITEVDLTQSTGSPHETANNSSLGKDNTLEFCTKNPELGKVNNVSIDYDELFDNMVSSINTNKSTGSVDTSTHSGFRDNIHSRTNTEDIGDDTNKSAAEIGVNIINTEGPPSQGKEISAYQFNHDVNFGGISIMDNLSHFIDPLSNNKKDSTNNSISHVHLAETTSNRDEHESKCNCSVSNCINNDNKSLSTHRFEAKTPSGSDFILKTNDITPMLDYEQMSTPARNRELEKYGIKPFKRKRAIQLLTYLYNQTHPVVQCTEEELPSSSKKQKLYNNLNSPSPNGISHQNLKSQTSGQLVSELVKPSSTGLSPIKSNLVSLSPKKSTSSDQSPINSNMAGLTLRKSKSPRKGSPNNNKENIYMETKQQPDIKELYCSSDDWVFQKREKAKVHSCRVPLHIAFHNYVSCRKLLREAILCYEPVNIDIVHKELVAYGYRYNPKELLRFLDKKCITVKTLDKTRNKS